ncbi:protein-export chaperone SecB [Pseudoalteromonas sp. McH1-7]|uniref:Protein-export protein SecB n=1 Tax=Pseudoalteromonas peptidolytica F12-50-A1 TaxID=1315280 RepID=A0A8I0T636_9GAMM|nr:MULTISPECIES: protein-export chaperone SecB [Pseudoalteromonas]MBE0347898.1 hypothetical protein [Pseudoalteromonas peptidolytica F12-50-A1]MDW7551332.1 protein-export chaperone SecB [Pseudoalteromonas peptidolytica]NLR15302.1 protein-export chaperone SecB [Pseudoalteromonas peptidolytica]NUZ11947.1 protein-export chaperone SecB [Pseudoalteromonas sp. McH1-7]RXF00985.1 protein-export chaperone SecB [Pseudoalteromonas sp. PS5]
MTNKDNTTAVEQSFELQKIYHKKSTFDAPNAPAVFLDEWKPSISVDLNTEANRISDTTYEVVLTVKCKAKATNSDTQLFNTTVEQAGIFEIEGYEETEIMALVGSYCPAQLYPFARNHISSQVLHGGFPQLLLAPVDFDALLDDAIKSADQESQGSETNDTDDEVEVI